MILKGEINNSQADRRSKEAEDATTAVPSRQLEDEFPEDAEEKAREAFLQAALVSSVTGYCACCSLPIKILELWKNMRLTQQY